MDKFESTSDKVFTIMWLLMAAFCIYAICMGAYWHVATLVIASGMAAIQMPDQWKEWIKRKLK